MLKKKLTFLLIPDSDGVSRQVSVRVALVAAIVVVVLSMTTATFFFSAKYFSDRVSQQELTRLEAENKALAEKYELLRWNVAELEDRYRIMTEKEATIRMAFDLPEISSEERQLGIGGPIPEAVSDLSAVERIAYESESEVDRLLKTSQFELEKYSEVENQLNNIKDRLDHTPSIWPTRGWKASAYGMREDPFTGYRTMHRGIDIANHNGTPIVAPANGRVKSVSNNGNMGKVLVIDHGYGFQTRYGHLAEIKVKRGQRVTRGDVVALMGASGRTTGPHLHYEVIRNGKFYNPMKYILNEM